MKPKSDNVDKFQHDDQAEHYENDVADESHPIRQGYLAVLEWVASRANEFNPSSVLEFGSGTGNLSEKLRYSQDLTCVDASEKMIKRAKQKLQPLKNIKFVKNDFLEFWHYNKFYYDAIVSTYALHHLTQTEKSSFLKQAFKFLKRDGVIVIGDLAFWNTESRNNHKKFYETAGFPDISYEIDDEFYWLMNEDLAAIDGSQSQLKIVQISPLSWVFLIQKRTLI